MSTIIYQSTITEIGEFAADALADGMLITFKQGAPADLADYCFIHSHSTPSQEVMVGDSLQLGSADYPITAMGDVAMTNLRELGHVTVRFDAATAAELPGCIHVAGEIPAALAVGTVMTIVTDK